MRSVFKEQEIILGKYTQKVSAEEATIESLAYLMSAEYTIPSAYTSISCSRSEGYEKRSLTHGGETHRVAGQRWENGRTDSRTPINQETSATDQYET